MIKEAKLIKIGNSQGIRLPKPLISKYGLGEHVIIETLPEGILIHASENAKLSWEDTYKAMATEGRDEWDDWQAFDNDLESHL